MRKNISAGVLLIALLVLTISVPEADSADNKNIVVLSADQLTSTSRAISGAKKIISRSHSNVIFHDFLVDTSPGSADSQIESIRKLSPTLILSVGTSATSLARDNFPDIPIVFAAVKYPVMSGFVESLSSPGQNITGASLNIPTEVQFRYFKTILPELTKMGVLYTAQTKSLIAPATKVAAEMGVELIAIEIKENKQLPGALDSLARTTDGLWSVADPQLFTPQSTRFILLNTLRKNLPLMGFSRHVVESGALFALDFDYKAVGRQAGDIASKIISGKSPSQIPVSMVDLLWFHYNEKTAKHLKIEMPSEMVAVAKEVYR
ncbi:MAG: ABC transporter substrate-binding protein [bacterium]|nr:ABC transporter substrate-binding protein [bacterium]